MTSTHGALQPQIIASVSVQSSGSIIWRFDMDWSGTGIEGSYEVLMQLGRGFNASDADAGADISPTVTPTPVKDPAPTLYPDPAGTPDPDTTPIHDLEQTATPGGDGNSGGGGGASFVAVLMMLMLMSAANIFRHRKLGSYKVCR